MSNNDKNRRRKLKLHAINPFCHWCGVETRITHNPNGQIDQQATIDHVVSKYFAGYSDTKENTVLACRRCNVERAKDENTLFKHKREEFSEFQMLNLLSGKI